jgi:hypothetical protein
MSKIIRLMINQVRSLSIYALLLIVNAFSQSTYIKVEESNISHKG